MATVEYYAFFYAEGVQLENGTFKIHHFPPPPRAKEEEKDMILPRFSGFRVLNFVWLDFLCFTCKTATSNKEKTRQAFLAEGCEACLCGKKHHKCHLTFAR